MEIGVARQPVQDLVSPEYKDCPAVGFLKAIAPTICLESSMLTLAVARLRANQPPSTLSTMLLLDLT